MKRLAGLVWLTLAFGVCAAPIGIVVPAYFYPGSLWSSMDWASTQVPLVAIMNPNSGPDTSQNSDYVAAVNTLRAAGGKVIGYVSTSYTTRTTNSVMLDIDRYFSFYSVDGIFLDEFTNDTDPNHLGYYAALYQYIQSKGTNLLVLGNPGINTEAASLNQALPATQLRLLNVSNGVPTLQIDGAPGTYELQASTNLVVWTKVAMVNNSTNLVHAEHAGATNSSFLFYRTRQ